jgi:choline dehydrogenase-like flavoprotein
VEFYDTRAEHDFVRGAKLHALPRPSPVELWVDQPGHLLGTARMGNDPATSVVDPRAHDVPNLFLAGGSIFVTGGSANPTCTISALALRVAEHIAANAKGEKVSA